MFKFYYMDLSNINNNNAPFHFKDYKEYKRKNLMTKY